MRRAFQHHRVARADHGWARRYALGAGLTGALWGTLAATVPVMETPAYHMLVGLTAAGMCAGAVASLSVHPPSFYAYMVPCLVPTAAVFLAAGDAPHVGLGLMAVAFAITLGFVVRGSNGSFVETLRLRFQNAELARELSVTRDIAEQASRSNSETLAHLSHEMRTPLNAISGFADIMRRHIFGALGHRKYDEYANDIGESAAHLTDLVEQILLYSRGDTGTLRIDEAVINLVAEIDNCLRMIEHAAARAGSSCAATSPRISRFCGPIR